MSEPLRVSIIVIGDEILDGYVQDTNSGWLAGRLRRLGIPLERVVTIGDEVDVIASALAEEFARPRPRLVLTSGGIGSTPDDRTMEAAAAWFRVELVDHPELVRRLDALTRESDAVEDPQRSAFMRMARVPAGAELLAGVDGIAPGVVLRRDGGIEQPGGATLVILPGVPGQLRRIMTDGIEPQLLSGRGAPRFVTELTHPYPESTLTPLLDRLVREYPGMHVGSYPGYECLVRLSGDRGDVEAAAREVTDYLDRLRKDPAAVLSSRRWQQRWAGA